MSITQKHCKVLKTKFCKVSGHVSVYFCIPQNNRTTMAPTIDKSFCELKMMTAVLLPGKVKYDPQGRKRNDKLMFFRARWKTAVKRTWVKVLFSNEDIVLSEKRERIIF